MKSDGPSGRSEALHPPLKKNYIPSGNTAKAGTPHILIVDDDPLLARVTQKQLEIFGYTVTAVTVSKHALSMIRADPYRFDLLLTDLSMPGLSGTELARAAVAENPAIPVILFSGHNHMLSTEENQVSAIRHYLKKPVAGEDLLMAVRSVLAGTVDRIGARG